MHPKDCMCSVPLPTFCACTTWGSRHGKGRMSQTLQQGKAPSRLPPRGPPLDPPNPQSLNHAIHPLPDTHRHKPATSSPPTAFVPPHLALGRPGCLPGRHQACGRVLTRLLTKGATVGLGWPVPRRKPGCGSCGSCGSCGGCTLALALLPCWLPLVEEAPHQARESGLFLRIAAFVCLRVVIAVIDVIVIVILVIFNHIELCTG